LRLRWQQRRLVSLCGRVKEEEEEERAELAMLAVEER